jgi:hypothetical protein
MQEECEDVLVGHEELKKKENMARKEEQTKEQTENIMFQ